MKLVIHAHALKNESLSQAITGHFDERGGTIGRSDTNTLTLPDPERHVSRLQAEVLFAGRGFSIRNVGSANPIELNGRALRPGEGAPLAAGDNLVIGGYAMRVVAEEPTAAGVASQAPRVDSRTVIRASAGEARTDPPPRPPMSAPATPVGRRAPGNPSVSDPFADLMGGPGPTTTTDPFADLMSPAAPAEPAVTLGPATRPPPRRPAAPPRADLDPFADMTAPPKAVADSGFTALLSPSGTTKPGPAKDAPLELGLDDLLGPPGGGGAGSAGARLDDLFDLGGPSAGKGAGGDLLDEFLSPLKPAGGTAPGDLLDLFGDKPASARQPKAPAAFDHTPALEGAYSPPAVKPLAPPAAAKKPSAPPSVVPPAPVVPAAAAVKPRDEPARPRMVAAPPPVAAGATTEAPASPEALWRAFCEGSGINLSLPQGLNPAMMRQIGQVMHHAVEGALKLVAARAAAKQELRAQVTTIQSKNNNPLKFSVDPQQALAQLLQPPMRGFMPGPDAVRDAMDDLLGHNIGTMAGTRAALQGMLKRFEPARLEAKLTNKGVIDAVLPMNRRAKLWELYIEHYQQVQDEAQDDFHELFGKAFVKAYEQQLDRLEASRRKAG